MGLNVRVASVEGVGVGGGRGGALEKNTRVLVQGWTRGSCSSASAKPRHADAEIAGDTASMGGWEALEKQVIAAGEKVKTLKTGGGEKEAVDAAVADLLSLKTAFTAALEEAIAAAPDEAAKEALRAKVPPAPKPSKRDKKADKATAKGDAPADADKAANIKAAEELKAAARAKKKAEAEAKAGAPPPAPKQPPSAQPAAAAPPAQKPTTTNVAVRKPGEPLTRDVIVAAIGKVLFLKLSKEDAQQLYKEAGTKPDWNVVARYTRQCLRSKESAASISSHFVSALSILNEVLEPQMFLSGGASPCVADIACYVALIACMQAFSASPPHTQALCNVTRWFDYLQHTIDALHPPDALGAACKVRACGLRVSLALATPSATHAFTTVLFTSARSSLGLASQVSFNLEMPDTTPDIRSLPALFRAEGGASNAAGTPDVSDPPGGAGAGGGGEKAPPKEKAAKKEKEKPAAPPPPSDDGQSDVSKLDIRVGLIISAEQHPDAEKLYVEKVDLGEESGPRTVVSGLKDYMDTSALTNRRAVLLCNLKPAKMRGIESQAMVLCASIETPDQRTVELLTPPDGAAIGERIMFDGCPGEPLPANQVAKKKVWEAVQPELSTNADRVAMYKNLAFQTSKGPCTVATLKNGAIK